MFLFRAAFVRAGVLRTSAAVNLWLHRVLPHGTVCSVFPAIPFLACNVKSASHDFVFSPYPNTVNVYSTGLAVHTRSQCWARCYQAFPEPLAVGVLRSRQAANYPTLFCHISSATHMLGNRSGLGVGVCVPVFFAERRF